MAIVEIYFVTKDSKANVVLLDAFLIRIYAQQDKNSYEGDKSGYKTKKILHLPQNRDGY